MLFDLWFEKNTTKEVMNDVLSWWKRQLGHKLQLYACNHDNQNQEGKYLFILWTETAEDFLKTVIQSKKETKLYSYLAKYTFSCADYLNEFINEKLEIVKQGVEVKLNQRDKELLNQFDDDIGIYASLSERERLGKIIGNAEIEQSITEKFYKSLSDQLEQLE